MLITAAPQGMGDDTGNCEARMTRAAMCVNAADSRQSGGVKCIFEGPGLVDHTRDLAQAAVPCKANHGMGETLPFGKGGRCVALLG